METIIINERPNGLKTKSVLVLCKQKKDYRQIELVLDADADIEAVLAEKDLWADAKPIENGVVLWRKAEKVSKHLIVESVREAMWDTLETGGDISELLGLARRLISGDEDLLTEWQRLGKLIEATPEAKRWELIALWMVVSR